MQSVEILWYLFKTFEKLMRNAKINGNTAVLTPTEQGIKHFLKQTSLFFCNLKIKVKLDTTVKHDLD